MPRPKGTRKTARLSITLDERDYAALGAVARDNGVSAAWVVRRAVTEFLERRDDSAQPEFPLVRRLGEPDSRVN